MDLYPVKFTVGENAPLAATIGFAIIGLLANLLLLFITAATIGAGLKIGLGL